MLKNGSKAIGDLRYWISHLTGKLFSSFVRYNLNSFQTSKDGFLKIAPFLLPYAFLNQAKTPCSSIQSLGRDRTIMPLRKSIFLSNVFRLKITNGDKCVPFKITVKLVFSSWPVWPVVLNYSCNSHCAFFFCYAICQ